MLTIFLLWQEKVRLLYEEANARQPNINKLEIDTIVSFTKYKNLYLETLRTVYVD